MTEENSNSKHEKQLQFFLAEHKIAAEDSWKYNEFIWNVFKFYITLLTGASGLALALRSVG